MLSATPVNNQFLDLKNQLALAYEGNAGEINKKLGDGKNIDHIFREAQKAFNRWNNRASISRLFASVYRKFNIQGASHLGRHLFVSKLVNSGVNICIVQKLANHKNISTTQHYFNYNDQMLANAVENVRI